MKSVQITGDLDVHMLIRIVERGWSGGDFAEYLDDDQIVACMRVLDRLGIHNEPPSKDDDE